MAALEIFLIEMAPPLFFQGSKFLKNRIISLFFSLSLFSLSHPLSLFFFSLSLSQF